MENKKNCPHCDEEKPLDEFHYKKTEKRYNSWCKVCLYESQKVRWVDRKKKAVELMGGKCCKCGYKKNYAAMDFHHLDPSDKEYEWAEMRLRPWKKVVEELGKCILVCRNCHAEIHNPHYSIKELSKKELFDLNDNNNLNILSTGECPECSSPVYGTNFCSQICSAAARRVVERPSFTELKELIENESWCAIGRKYKVSDNAVRKWAKNYGLL